MKKCTSCSCTFFSFFGETMNFLSFYSANAAIPGPTVQTHSMPTVTTQNSGVSYAHPAFAQLSGAPVLSDVHIQQWNAANLSKRALTKEFCGCKKKENLKKL